LDLDRSAEVKTLRRKLRELGRRGLAYQFLRGIARRIADDHKDLLGYLYVDGHVRAYHGGRPAALFQGFPFGLPGKLACFAQVF
jgi:prepilin-type processing-associated H-X9-DG protein